MMGIYDPPKKYKPAPWRGKHRQKSLRSNYPQSSAQNKTEYPIITGIFSMEKYNLYKKTGVNNKAYSGMVWVRGFEPPAS